MNQEPAADLISRLSIASHSLSKADVRSLHKACEVGKATLARDGAAFIRSVGASPLLSSASADGTPVREFVWQIREQVRDLFYSGCVSFFDTSVNRA